MWQALGDLPETYREPLVLFYRDGETVAGVAAALDLTEAAVKQRLARGREMLRTDLAAMVEWALKRSAPGAAFTAAKGGVACPHDFAVGASATAAHANDQGARDFVARCGFFDAGERLMGTMSRLPGWASLVLFALIALAVCAVWPVAYRRRRPE